MSKRASGYTALYAIIGLDHSHSLPERIVIPKVVLDMKEAELETKRLNDLNGDKTCSYIWKSTVVESDTKRPQDSTTEGGEV
jgi:hypothetical protein